MLFHPVLRQPQAAGARPTCNSTVAMSFFVRSSLVISPPRRIISGSAVPGTIYADLSTGSPTVMRRLHAAFKDKGVHLLDSPVSGGTSMFVSRASRR